MNIHNLSNADIFIACFVAVFCVIGFVKGVIRQFFGILAFGIASAASVLVPYFIKIPPISGASPIWGYIIFSVMVWVPSFLVFNLIGKFFAKKMTKKGIKFGDRLWGFIFGGFKGVLILVVVVFFVDILPDSLKNSIPPVAYLFNHSRIVSIARVYNPLLKIDVMQNLQMVMSAINNPDYMELLAGDDNFQRLKNSDIIKSISNDPELEKIIEEHQYMKFMTNSKVKALLEDEETLKLLLSVDIDKSVISNI